MKPDGPVFQSIDCGVLGPLWTAYKAKRQAVREAEHGLWECPSALTVSLLDKAMREEQDACDAWWQDATQK